MSLAVRDNRLPRMAKWADLQVPEATPSQSRPDTTRRALEASIREGERQQSALPLTLRGRYTAPLHAQLGRLLLKDLRSYWRTPEYNATRLTISLGVALIFGSMYWMRARRRCCEAEPACMCVVIGVPWVHLS